MMFTGLMIGAIVLALAQFVVILSTPAKRGGLSGDDQFGG